MNVEVEDEDVLVVVALGLWTIAMAVLVAATVQSSPRAAWLSELYFEAIVYATVIVMVLDRVTDAFGEFWLGFPTGAWIHVALFALLALVGLARLAFGAGTSGDRVAAGIGAVGVLVLVTLGWWKRDRVRSSA